MAILNGKKYSRISVDIILAAEFDKDGVFNSYIGPQKFSTGDYLIQEIDGKQYVVPSHVFEKNYNLVKDAIIIDKKNELIDENDKQKELIS